MPYRDPDKRRKFARDYAAARPTRRDAAYLRQTKESNARRYSARTTALTEMLNSIKADRGCIDCGNEDYRVLDFDHRDRAHKSFGISRAVFKTTLSTEAILAEIEKCDVRCANCHRIKTFVENIMARL